jgi:hypothetical protein
VFRMCLILYAGSGAGNPSVDQAGGNFATKGRSWRSTSASRVICPWTCRRVGSQFLRLTTSDNSVNPSTREAGGNGWPVFRCTSAGVQLQRRKCLSHLRQRERELCATYAQGRILVSLCAEVVRIGGLWCALVMPLPW